MSNKRILVRRQWLRPAKSWGPQSSVHSTIEQEQYSRSGGKYYNHINGSFGLRDCSDYVSLDFNASNEKEYHYHLKAIDKLLHEIQLVRKGWIKAHDQVMERGGWRGET